MPKTKTGELARLRVKEQRYDELVQQLAVTKRQLAETRRSHCREGIDPAWREIATDLATALRPYTLLSLRAGLQCGFSAAARVEDAVDNEGR